MYISPICRVLFFFWLFILPFFGCKQSYVLYVIDGDTFAIYDSGRVRYVRLLGIDTPEKGVKGYNQSKQFLKSIVEHKKVFLCRDIENTDRYGRKLRYVLTNNTLVNYELFARGFADPLVLFPNCGSLLLFYKLSLRQ